MSRIGPLARTYWLDLLVAVMALGAMLEIVARRDAETAPRTTLWFVLPAIAILVLPVLARRRYPFGAAAAYLAAGCGSLLRRRASDSRSRRASASSEWPRRSCSGTCASSDRRGSALRIALGGAAIVVDDPRPTRRAASSSSPPSCCGIAGYAPSAPTADRRDARTLAEQAEAAEARAAQAEREREAAARIAVAEERARIARELHDIVAHSVSVMVLQVGAVRHKLPGCARGRGGCAERVEQNGPDRARRDASPPRRDAA